MGLGGFAGQKASGELVDRSHDDIPIGLAVQRPQPATGRELGQRQLIS
jgi:hypothetical protein